MADNYVTMTEAQEILGVSRFKVWQLVRDGKLTAYQSEVDRRQKLIRRDDLDELRNTRTPVTAGEAKKAVALAA